ncbi:MAG: FxLYD domain-containing protein [bacterium]|nr:FxLYD domain-containing protein [bacterium]
MPDNVVKDYHSQHKQREAIVLDLVKKYPLHSLNKLASMIPDVSRHSIQLILEKHDLSTVEKRLAFCTPIGIERDRQINFLKHFPFGVYLSKLRKKITHVPTAKIPFGRLGGVALFLLISFWVAGYVFATPPTIDLGQPRMDFVNSGERLYVSGRVMPVGSKVKVNSTDVLLNGDGTFTAVVKIPLGESSLEVTSSYKNRESKLVRLVRRIETEVEAKQRIQEEADKRQESLDKLAALDRNVNDLLAAQNATSGDDQALVRILSNQLKEEAGLYRVTGQVVNDSDEEVGWVMITATYYDKAGGFLDTKYGFATDFGQTIKPQATANFETQATSKPVDHYSLSLSWKGSQPVAGAESDVGGSSIQNEKVATNSALER